MYEYRYFSGLQGGSVTTVAAPPPILAEDQIETYSSTLLAELLLFAGVTVAHAPLLWDHFANLWTRPHYQYFPVVFLAVAYLAYDRWRHRRVRPSVICRPLGIAAIVMSIALLVFASVVWSPTLGAMSFVVGVGGGLLVIQEKIRVRNSFGLWLLFWLIVPAPMGLDARLANYLQGVTTYVSGLLLDLFGVVNVVDGNTLILSTGRLFVEEACSGIVSLMAVIACSIIIAVWNNRPLVHLALLTMCAIGWAAFMNTMRIVVIGFCMVKLDVDLSKGWQHEVVGLVLFGVTLLLTISTDRFVGFILHPVWSGPEQVAQKEKSKLVRIWNAFFALGFPSPDTLINPATNKPVEVLKTHRNSTVLIPFAGCLIVAGLFSGYCFAARDGSGNVIPQELIARADVLGPQSLSSEVLGWNQTQFQATRAENRKIFGEYSKVWVFEKDGRVALFSVDFMFNEEWHELCVCYEGIGWERLFRTVNSAASPPFVVADFQKNEQEFGLLQYSMISDVGKPYDPPATQSFTSLMQRRLKKGTHRNLQMQLWATNEIKLSSQQKEELGKLYLELRLQLSRNLFRRSMTDGGVR